MKWNADQYGKFERERTLPARDLADAIDIVNPEKIIDIGCGIGNSTEFLKMKFPNADIVGADLSEEMLESARKNHPDLKFIKLDASCDLQKLDCKYDIVFSNACIQWIPDHRQLLKNMLGLLNKGGVLAVQTPLQSKHPMHRIIKDIAKSEKWSKKLSSEREFHNLTEEEYFDILSELSSDFRIWETVYYHRMPSHQSIIEWYKGTGLRPYLNQLSDRDARDFEGEVLKEAGKEYSIQNSGDIIFRFPRLFFTAVK